MNIIGVSATTVT